jgi:hypothetical protein
MNQDDALVAFWAECPTQPPYCHPADFPFLRPHFSECERAGITFDLMPQPWVGPLNKAVAFILQLNPGLSGSEIETEKTNQGFRDALRANLGGELPNIFLDNRFKAHPGRDWVERKLKGVAPMEWISRHIAQLELFPYHSKNFTGVSKRLRQVLFSLPSVNKMLQFVHGSLLPRSQSGECTMVVMRSVRDWGLDGMAERGNVIIYRGWECQNGQCTPSMRGGRALMQCAKDSEVQNSHCSISTPQGVHRNDLKNQD